MNITFLSGLPRTGSTLLTSILSQNPELHTEGNSALCQVLWDAQVSCWNTEQLHNRPTFNKEYLESIPKLFYKDIDKQIIDKCRSWTIEANLKLINNYITESPNIIVMLRSIVDIVKSFVFIREMNGWSNPEQGLLDDNSEPIMRSLSGVYNSKNLTIGNFIYIWYDDLVYKPEETINKIYDFCGWTKFNHTFIDIVNLNPEPDELLGMSGLHDIRQTLEKREFSVKLTNRLHKKATLLDKELGTI